MGELFLLSPDLPRIDPYFPVADRVPLFDDRRVAGVVVFAIRDGLRWRDAPPAYDPRKTIYDRFTS